MVKEHGKPVMVRVDSFNEVIGMNEQAAKLLEKGVTNNWIIACHIVTVKELFQILQKKQRGMRR